MKKSLATLCYLAVALPPCFGQIFPPNPTLTNDAVIPPGTIVCGWEVFDTAVRIPEGSNGNSLVTSVRFALDTCKSNLPFAKYFDSSLTPFIESSESSYRVTAYEIYGPCRPTRTDCFLFSLEPAQIYELSDKEVRDLAAGLWSLHVVGPDFPNGRLINRIRVPDQDADGVPDFFDECAYTPAGDVVDSWGCGISQLCPCAGPWKNHGQYVRCVVRTLLRFKREGLLNKRECRNILREAAHSNCGKRPRMTRPGPIISVPVTVP